MSDDSKAFDSQTFLKNLTAAPGVYRMLDKKGQVIYVGKAKNLKKRVTSYFRTHLDSAKTKKLMSHVAAVEVTITASENEALILENNLIKKLQPRYNILFRDDKSYPFILLTKATKDHPFSRLTLYRSKQKKHDNYFGPFPSSGAARESLNIIQKTFRIRQCEDSFFQNRSRPCLQYQIKRCTAPCVGYISEADYAHDIRHAKMFLQGKSTAVIEELIAKMAQAASEKNYEQAALLRDQIASLRSIQEQQYVMTTSGDIDVVTAVSQHGIVCVCVLFIRHGRLLGNQAYFPKIFVESTTPAEVLGKFIAQFYLTDDHDQSLSKEIITNEDFPDRAWLTSSLADARGAPFKITVQPRGLQKKWVQMADKNAAQALQQRLADKAQHFQRIEALVTSLKLDHTPQRYECFDISHTGGEATIASCVVFDTQGPVNSDYRRFNIQDITQGDDYAAMRQVLMRRYQKLKQGEGKLPDMIIIDGGKGQLTQAKQVLEELQITDVILLGISKGPGRKPGLESLHLQGQQLPIHLDEHSPALHFLQHIRDEAHRFAIGGHRLKRAKLRSSSALETVAGVGQYRRKQLLQYFGGLQALKRANVEEIAKTPGISHALAQKIFDALHEC